MPLYSTIEAQMKSLFADVLDVGEENLERDTPLFELQLDTLDTREITEGIQSQFCVDFDQDMLDDAVTFGELVKLVTMKAGN